MLSSIPNPTTGVYTPVAAFDSPAAPTLTQTDGNTRSNLYNLRIKYIRQFGGHDVNVFVAGEQQENYSDNISAGRVNFPTPAIDQLFAGSATNQTATGSAAETGRQNVFGRVGYGFREKYFFDFNFRYDGSANFPEGKRFGFFPGASVAWRISQEKFMRDNLPFINETENQALIRLNRKRPGARLPVLVDIHLQRRIQLRANANVITRPCCGG